MRNCLNTSIIPVGIIFFLFLAGYWSVYTQTIPDLPQQWVEDYADLLNDQQEGTLNQMLRAYEDSTSNQIIIATFQDAQGYPVEDFSIQLAEKWKPGQQNRDNGIILAVFLQERKTRIEVGYGLEDMVPDAVAIQVADNVIAPYFKQGNFYEGLFQGAQALMQAASGKYKALEGKPKRDDGHSDFPFVLLVFIFLIFLSLFRRRRFSNVGSRGWRHTGPFWWGGMGGGFGGSRGGGGGFGGFSGGGGSFGGGGATGSW